jgi:ATP-dependent DNA helicase DinG
MADHFDMQQIFGPRGMLAQALSHYEERPQQGEMSERVWDAIQARQILLVEAGTGTGKTLAYLIPAILSGLKVVVSTGTKNLQEQIFSKDIPFLQQVLPRPFSAAYMKGAKTTSASGIAELRQQPALPGLVDRVWLQRLEHWAEETATGDRAELADLPDDAFVWVSSAPLANPAWASVVSGTTAVSSRVCARRQQRPISSSSTIISSSPTSPPKNPPTVK